VTITAWRRAASAGYAPRVVAPGMRLLFRLGASIAAGVACCWSCSPFGAAEEDAHPPGSPGAHPADSGTTSNPEPEEAAANDSGVSDDSGVNSSCEGGAERTATGGRLCLAFDKDATPSSHFGSWITSPRARRRSP
jgi:hypothetical protein